MLDPSFIEDEILQDVAHVACEHVMKYGGPPSLLVLEEECGKEVVDSRAFSRVWKASLQDIDYVVQKYAGFCRHQAVRKAILDAAELAKQDKIDALIPILQKAINTGTDFHNLGTFLRKDLDKRLLWYQSDRRNLRVIPTGWEPLDHIMEGGPGAGELCIIAGNAKAGKSQMLINLGANAVSSLVSAKRVWGGVKVLHVTLENSEEKTWKRYDKIFAGKVSLQMKEKPKAFGRALRSRLRQHVHPESDLVVVRFPNKTLTTQRLHAHMEMLGNVHGWIPDLLIVDYLDEMRANQPTGELRHDITQITSDLRALGIEWQLPVWTATQLQRGQRKVSTGDNASESIDKVRIADAFMTINSTEEEYNNGQMRLYLSEMRDAASKITIDMSVDRELGLIQAIGRREQIQTTSPDEALERQTERALKTTGASSLRVKKRA